LRVDLHIINKGFLLVKQFCKILYMRPGHLRIYASSKRRPGNIGDNEDELPVFYEEVEVGYIPELMKYSSRFPYPYPSAAMPLLRDPMTFNTLMI
jgi:hypothetical protein